MTKVNAVPSIKKLALFNLRFATCLVSKTKHPLIEHPQLRLTRPLELTHTDMSRKIGVPSLIGAHYFLVFVDNCTRMSSVYCISEKSQILQCLSAYKTLAEKQSSMENRRYKIGLNYAGEQTSKIVCRISIFV